MREPIVKPETVVNSQLWLDAANAVVRAYCGWHIAPSITETLLLDGNGTKTLLLPSMHVTDVKSVKIWNEDVTNLISWSSAGMLQWSNSVNRIFPDGFRSIEIKLKHGFDVVEVPEVAALISTLARRGASQSVIASQSVNGASVSYLTAGGAPLSIPLLAIEKQVLDPYRLAGRIIS